jgi:hypothetical protein
MMIYYRESKDFHKGLALVTRTHVTLDRRLVHQVCLDK